MGQGVVIYQSDQRLKTERKKFIGDNGHLTVSENGRLIKNDPEVVSEWHKENKSSYVILGMLKISKPRSITRFQY